MKRHVSLLVVTFLVGCSSPSGPKGGSGGSGGEEETGGSTGTGGKTSTGGKTGTGGSSDTGGSTGTGGSTSTGGATGTGGSGDTGGSTGTGGSTATGGTMGTGGATGTGGSMGTGGASGGTTQCGTMMPTLAGFNAAESLVVGPDGTIYSCGRNANLGRNAPPYDKPQNTWLTISNASVFGIALDPKKKVLYAAARDTNKIYRIPTDNPMMNEVLASTMGTTVNGVTLGADGAVYYGDQLTGRVYRLDPETKMTTQVTKTTVNQANGIAFDPMGRLNVLSYANPGVLTRFQVDANHVEVMGTRESFTIAGSRNADGIAFDKNGNAFVTAGALYKVTPDGKAMMVNGTGGANVEFGAGALSCKLILWATSSGIHTLMSDAEGAEVPWHHM
jgi:sugar lactone lactonase YvrE